MLFLYRGSREIDRTIVDAPDLKAWLPLLDTGEVLSTLAKKRAVFLDRDGVLNEAMVRDGRPHPPSESELRILPGVVEACHILREAGFLLIMVTNQPDIERGTISQDAVIRMNDRLQDWLSLDAVRVCPHDGDWCLCRKPKPGLLVDAANQFGVDLRASFMVGDRWRDTEAAQNAGCAAIFIDYGYREPRPKPPYHRVTSLREAASWIIGHADRDVTNA